jgi:hypothetical protein
MAQFGLRRFGLPPRAGGGGFGGGCGSGALLSAAAGSSLASAERRRSRRGAWRNLSFSMARRIVALTAARSASVKSIVGGMSSQRVNCGSPVGETGIVHAVSNGRLAVAAEGCARGRRTTKRKG